MVLLALVLGAGLRLWFVHACPVLEGDPMVYGDIAKNLILHHVYGLSGDAAQIANGGVAGQPSPAGLHPTLIRLPGYPLFVALCFKTFGMEHYNAIMYAQLVIDLATCLLIASLVKRLCGPRAGIVALWLAALCPFTSNFVASPMAETLSIFCVALAFYSLANLIDRLGVANLLLLAFAVSYATLLRPDGALLGLAVFPALVIYGGRRWGWPRALRYALLGAALALLPFVPWTIRNERTFHVFEPLAPRYANDPGESTTPGFNRWTKTWTVDFASTYEVYWNANTDLIDPSTLPLRACDSPQQRQATWRLIEDYNQLSTVTPELDARFADLAAQRIRGHRLRYYIQLPLLRVADMALRPRTENLPIELRWWQYREHRGETLFAAAYAALNLAYFVAALAGFVRWPRLSGAMLAFALLRCLLLATVEAPETRYTLELFPVVIVFAAIGLEQLGTRRAPITRV